MGFSKNHFLIFESYEIVLESHHTFYVKKETNFFYVKNNHEHVDVIMK